MMKSLTIVCMAVGSTVLVSTASVTSAAVLLSTDFQDRTVSGSTASDIPWVTEGVADPGDMVASATLFDTTASENHFAPNARSWNTNVALVLTEPGLRLNTFYLEYRHFNISGAFQTSARDEDYTVSIRDAGNNVLFSQTINTGSGFTGVLEYNLGSLVLSDDQTYTLRIVNGHNPSNFSGLKSLTLVGVIPEPTSAGLMAAGLLMLGRRRRTAGDVRI